MNDKLKIVTGYENKVRIYVCTTTNLVDEARKIHSLWPTATQALGRTLTVGAMMGTMLKDNQSLAIKIEGSGPLGKIICEAHSDGNIMGFVANPEVYLKYNDGRINLKDAIGEGTITVSKDLYLKEPFTSLTPIVSGEIAEDFTYYFATSEQTPTSVGLGVVLSADDIVTHAGGFIIQALPGCSDEIKEILEDKIKKMAPLSQLLTDGKTIENILDYLTEEKYVMLEMKELKYHCSCTKQRFRQGIMSLGAKVIEEILTEDKQAVCHCHYCNKEYIYNEDDLVSMLNVCRKLNTQK